MAGWRTMQVTEANTEGLKRTLKVVVGADELGRRFSERLDEIKDRVQLKGFRKGKVPVPHLKKMYGRALVAVRDRLRARLLDGLLQHLRHQRAAIHLLQVRDRHLALAEALELDAVLDLVETLREAPAKLIRANHDLEGTLQSLGIRFRDLHLSPTCHLAVQDGFDRLRGKS